LALDEWHSPPPSPPKGSETFKNAVKAMVARLRAHLMGSPVCGVKVDELAPYGCEAYPDDPALYGVRASPPEGSPCVLFYPLAD
jgi:hypothetical protein